MPEEEEGSGGDWRQLAEAVGYLSAGGFQMAGLTAIGYFAGRWIDGKTHGAGLLTAVLAFAGFGAGVWQMWRALKALQRRQESRS